MVKHEAIKSNVSIGILLFMYNQKTKIDQVLWGPIYKRVGRTNSNFSTSGGLRTPQKRMGMNENRAAENFPPHEFFIIVKCFPKTQSEKMTLLEQQKIGKLKLKICKIYFPFS